MAVALEAGGLAGAAPIDGPLPLAGAAAARQGQQGEDSEAFCAALLQATGVALTPGNGFGPGGEGWARLALVHPTEQLQQGAARIGAWLAAGAPR